MECSFENCTADARKKGYCLKHYSHARRHGLIPVPPCSVDGCNSPVHGKGLCVAHYKRVAKHGDPSVCKKAANGTAHLVPCGFEGCGKPSISKGLCRRHFAYSQRNGLFDKAPCSVDGCDLYAYHGKDMCNTHLQRFQRYGDANFRRKIGNGEQTPENKREVARRCQTRYRNTPNGKSRQRFSSAIYRILSGKTLKSRHIDKEQLLAMWAATECAICGEPVADADKTIDHIIPVSRGGDNTIANLQIAHLRCNQLKGNRVDAANLPF